jgi:beta-glucanase (GH16 family)
MGSETEIDVEEQGSKPGEVEFTNWVNPLMGTMHRSLFEKPKQFHVFTYVWIPGKITYFVDGEEVGESITNVPNLPANFVFEFYAMNDETWGGTWKRGKRHMTVVDFHYSPKYYWRQP